MSFLSIHVIIHTIYIYTYYTYWDDTLVILELRSWWVFFPGCTINGSSAADNSYHQAGKCWMVRRVKHWSFFSEKKNKKTLATQMRSRVHFFVFSNVCFFNEKQTCISPLAKSMKSRNSHRIWVLELSPFCLFKINPGWWIYQIEILQVENSPTNRSKKSPTGPSERTPKLKYLIALATSLGVRW